MTTPPHNTWYAAAADGSSAAGDSTATWNPSSPV